MRKKIAALALSAVLVALFATADAQQPKKVPQIGHLAAGSAGSASSRVKAFRRADSDSIESSGACARDKVAAYG